jgi:N-terminal domain of toast_rack, DUF2154
MAVLCCAGCSFKSAGPMQHDSSSIDRDKSEMVRVNLRMGGGQLRVDGGTDKLVTADFDYNVPAWKPEVNYASSAGKGELTISQGERDGAHIGLHEKNDWSVHLNRDVPLEIVARLGGGDATLNLGSLSLRRVEMEIGAGDLKMDLRGSPKTSYDVRIRGGAGNATIHVPDGVGIDATATGGIGDISATGLHEDGHRYTNDLLGKSPVTIRLDVEGGVGSIHLDAGK